jgi:pimeloyl-ACP methyl ester carboxylesterase
MSMRGPVSHSFISQRLRLHYVEWGPEDAPPLLMLHGSRDHCRSWDWVAEDLCRDWRIIAPDLRGHGDSAWSPDGDYSLLAYIYDLAQIIHQLKLAPLTILAHSLGGWVSLCYAGLYPENVKKAAAIEGLGPGPSIVAARLEQSIQKRIGDWIDRKRAIAGRMPKRYASIEEACKRMEEENKYLSPEQARHLTRHGISQNEDGTYSWKFDQYVRVIRPNHLPQDDIHALWSGITCPVLLCYGEESWNSSPIADGRAPYFRDVKIVGFPDAGHWVHHDQFDALMKEVRAFI